MWRLNEEATRNLVKPWRKKKASLFFITLAVLALVLILDLALAPHPRLHVQSLKVDVSEPVPLAIVELDLKQGSFFSRLEPRGVHCSLEPSPQDDETENITAVIDIDVRLEKKDHFYRLVASPDEEDVDPFADILWNLMTRQDKSSILETAVCSFKVKVHLAHLIPIPITRKVELSDELVDELLNSHEKEREKFRVRVISTENTVNATGESTASPVRFDALELGLSIPTPAFADSATIVLPELTATVQPNNVSGWKVHMEETEYMFSTQGDGIALAITCNSPDCPWFQPLIDLYFHRASKILLSIRTSKASFLEATLGSQHQFSVDFEKKPLPTIPSRFLQLANISLPPYIPPIPPFPCAPIPASFNATSITYNLSCTENPSSPNITRTPRPTNLPTPRPTNLPTPTPSYVPTYMPWDIPTPMPSYMEFPTYTPTPPPTPPPTPLPTPLPTPPPTPLPTPPPSYSPTPMTPSPTSRPTPSPTPVPDSDELAECMALTSNNDSSAFQYDLCFLLEPSKGMSLVSKVEVYDYIGGAHASSTWESISWERVQVETKARIALNSDNDTINLQGTFLFDIRDDTNLQLDADFVNDGSWWPFVVSLNWNGYYAGNVLRMSMSNGQVQLVGEQDLLTNAVGSAILDIDQQTFESTVADTQVQFDAGGWIMGEQSVSGSSSLVVKGDTIWNAVVDGKLQVNAYDDWMASMELMDQKLQVALDGQLQQQDLAASSMCKFNGKVIWNTILQGMVRAANRELAITAEAIDEAQMLQLSTDIVASDYSDLSLAVNNLNLLHREAMLVQANGAMSFNADWTQFSMAMQDVAKLDFDCAVKANFVESPLLVDIMDARFVQAGTTYVDIAWGTLRYDSNNHQGNLRVTSNPTATILVGVDMSFAHAYENRKDTYIGNVQQLLLRWEAQNYAEITGQYALNLGWGSDADGTFALSSSPAARLQVNVDLGFDMDDALNLLASECRQLMVQWEEQLFADAKGQFMLEVNNVQGNTVGALNVSSDTAAYLQVGTGLNFTWDGREESLTLLVDHAQLGWKGTAWIGEVDPLPVRYTNPPIAPDTVPPETPTPNPPTAVDTVPPETPTPSGTSPPETLPPAPTGIIRQTVRAKFTVSNLQNMEAPSLVNSSGLGASWPAFVEEVVTATVIANQRSLREALKVRRRLLVELEPDSAYIYDIVLKDECGEGTHPDLICHDAFGQYNLLISAPDTAKEAEQLYGKATVDAIDAGDLQEVMDSQGAPLIAGTITAPQDDSATEDSATNTTAPVTSTDPPDAIVDTAVLITTPPEPLTLAPQGLESTSPPASDGGPSTAMILLIAALSPIVLLLIAAALYKLYFFKSGRRPEGKPETPSQHDPTSVLSYHPNSVAPTTPSQPFAQPHQFTPLAPVAASLTQAPEPPVSRPGSVDDGRDNNDVWMSDTMAYWKGPAVHSQQSPQPHPHAPPRSTSATPSQPSQQPHPQTPGTSLTLAPPEPPTSSLSHHPDNRGWMSESMAYLKGPAVGPEPDEVYIDPLAPPHVSTITEEEFENEELIPMVEAVMVREPSSPGRERLSLRDPSGRYPRGQRYG